VPATPIMLSRSILRQLQSEQIEAHFRDGVGWVWRSVSGELNRAQQVR